MYRAEKIRKTVTRMSAVMLLAVLFVSTSQTKANGDGLLGLNLTESFFVMPVGCSSTVSCANGSTATCEATGNGSECHNGKCKDGEGNKAEAQCGSGIKLVQEK